MIYYSNFKWKILLAFVSFDVPTLGWYSDKLSVEISFLLQVFAQHSLSSASFVYVKADNRLFITVDDRFF